MSIRLNHAGLRTTRRVGDTIVEIGHDRLAGQATVEVTGLAYLLGDWLDHILIGQRNGLALSFSVIAIMMIVGLRSFRSGLWSMIPNGLPLIALAGYVGLVWEQMDSDTMMIGMLAIGIGVDDTIHFLMRFRLESMKTEDRTLALRRTFDYAGRAILMTTVILALGFLPMAFSGYTTTRMFGTLLPGVLVVALLSDLLFVPALVQVGWIRFTRTAPDKPSVQES